MPPFFSIIIPSYNNEKLLHECISSALGQTFRDFEIIISDNASEDNSYNLAASFQDARIRLYRQTNNVGMYNNLNFCVGKSTGTFLKFLNSDDVMHPNCLDCIYTAIQELQNKKDLSTPVHIGHCKLVAQFTPLAWKQSDFRTPLYVKPDINNNLGISLPDACVSRKHFISRGLFGHPDPNKDFSRDVLSLGLSAMECSQIQVSQPLILERIHPNQSRNKMSSTKKYQLDEFFYLYSHTGYLNTREGQAWFYSLWINHLLSAFRYLVIHYNINYLSYTILFAVTHFPLKFRQAKTKYL